MLVHGSCAARHGHAVLILGPSGAGKSDLVLRLLQLGWRLVGDDQVECGADLAVGAPARLRGFLEVRGLGIFEAMEVEDNAVLRLAVQLAPHAGIPRLPMPASWRAGDGAAVPLVTLDPFEVSACAKLNLALDAATGLVRQRAGAFAA